jgi:hypothetical protein
MSYSDKVIDHYTNPRNIGTLDKSDLRVGTGLVGAPECGDVMRLQIMVEDEAIKSEPKLISMYDMLGRPVYNARENEITIYLYSDGSTRKVIQH